jgi:hypothetical protein
MLAFSHDFWRVLWLGGVEHVALSEIMLIS